MKLAQFGKKAYNSRINDITAEFINQFPSIFNNSGRLNHFNVCFWNNFFFIHI